MSFILIGKSSSLAKYLQHKLKINKIAVMSKRKAPSSSDNPNHKLCNVLTELANYERNVNKNIHKYNAYRKAASTLSGLTEPVKSGQDARQHPGIGDKIAKKIDEFLQTGKLQKLEKINQDERNIAIEILTRVSGIGPAKASELYDAGIKSLEDLIMNQDKLNHHQKLGLKYFADFEQKIPRDEIVQLEKIIKEHIAALDEKFILTVCGSYRRGKEESGDIDILVTHPTYTSATKSPKKGSNTLLENIVKCLENHKIITDTISRGDTKFMGVCRLNEKKPYRRLDIRLAPQDQYYCAVLYFTGSDVFNKNMRTHALENNYTLNEYTLKKLNPEGTPGEVMTINSEEDIFRILNYPYKKPEERSA